MIKATDKELNEPTLASKSIQTGDEYNDFKSSELKRFMIPLKLSYKPEESFLTKVLTSDNKYMNRPKTSVIYADKVLNNFKSIETSPIQAFQQFIQPTNKKNFIISTKHKNRIEINKTRNFKKISSERIIKPLYKRPTRRLMIISN